MTNFLDRFDNAMANKTHCKLNGKRVVPRLIHAVGFDRSGPNEGQYVVVRIPSLNERRVYSAALTTRQIAGFVRRYLTS